MFITVLTASLFAQKVEITSDAMHAENMKKEVHFIGNVYIKQGKNWLRSERVVVYFNKNNMTEKYMATGGVRFEFKQKKNFYQGKANNVTYFPNKSHYILEGNAVIDDKINNRHVRGDKIVFDMVTGNAKVKGSRKRPVKFIFDMDAK